MIYGERNMVDSEGFLYKYVPKDAIFVDTNSSGKTRKNSKKLGEGAATGNAYIYMKKTPTQQTLEHSNVTKSEKTAGINSASAGKKSTMQNLLSSLRPEISEFRSGQESEDEDDEDEDVRKIIIRKVSMNESNVIGTNL